MFEFVISKPGDGVANPAPTAKTVVLWEPSFYLRVKLDYYDLMFGHLLMIVGLGVGTWCGLSEWWIPLFWLLSACGQMARSAVTEHRHVTGASSHRLMMYSLQNLLLHTYGGSKEWFFDVIIVYILCQFSVVVK